MIDDPQRFNGVNVIGVDERIWSHARRGDKYVTVIIDLTPIRDGTGLSRPLDMGEGRSKKVCATWLQTRLRQLRDGVEAMAMDGFSGFKSSAADELPDAVPVMDVLHVVRLAGRLWITAGGAFSSKRAAIADGREIPCILLGGRCIPGPTCSPRSNVHALKSCSPLIRMLKWKRAGSVYQRMVAAYREPDRTKGREPVRAMIDSVSRGVLAGLTELKTLGRTMKRRAHDVLAYFDRPGTSNGPTETIKCCDVPDSSPSLGRSLGSLVGILHGRLTM